jgi:hypothetical protein
LVARQFSIARERRLLLVTAGEERVAEEGIAELVDELTRARRRGLDRLDSVHHGQVPIDVPILERLARQYAGDGQSDRIAPIRKLLWDALAAWGEADHRDEAAFVRGLFFTTDGSSPGRHASPKVLREVVRAGQPEEAFRRRREDLFRLFAIHLVSFAAIRQPPPPPPPPRRPARWQVAGVALLVLLVGTLGFALGAAVAAGAARPPDSSAAGGSATQHPLSEPTSPDGQLVAFRFDDLGGGLPVIEVYPGVADTPTDRRYNGTFYSGDVVTAVCRTKGRTVTSNPSVGERPHSSDDWVQIIGLPGKTHYASLTYGEITPEDLASLPLCGPEVAG